MAKSATGVAECQKSVIGPKINDGNLIRLHTSPKISAINGGNITIALIFWIRLGLLGYARLITNEPKSKIGSIVARAS